MSFNDIQKDANSYFISPDDGSSHYEKLLYRKNFKFNNYDAMVVCVSDQTSGQTALCMSFGDENFGVQMRGICRSGDTEALHQMLYAFLTSCPDKSKA